MGLGFQVTPFAVFFTFSIVQNSPTPGFANLIMTKNVDYMERKIVGL